MQKLHAMLVGLLLTTATAAQAGEPIPPMKFNDVREVAPGVFFRYASISATDKSIPFGGSNNIWVVFEDYVVVYDANFLLGDGSVRMINTSSSGRVYENLLSRHDGNSVGDF